MIALLTILVANLATQPPQLLASEDPEYPATALSDRVEATVTVRLEVDINGVVTAVTVVRTSTRAEDETAIDGWDPRRPVDYGFGESATRAAKKLRFSQAFIDGDPVPFVLDYTYEFLLPELPPPVITRDRPREQIVATGRLRGVVRAAGNRARVANAYVVVEKGDTTQERITDAEGVFVFEGLEPGPWDVRIDLLGYVLASSREEIAADELTSVTYYLEPTGEEGYDVVVEAEPVRREVTRRALSTAEIVRVPGTLGDPVLVVENLPGVARTGLDGGAAVRGSSPQDTVVMMEGMPVLIETHFGGFRSVIAPQLVERIDFVPGNFSTRYGRRLGGVLDVRTKRLAPDQLHGALELSVLDFGLYAEAPITDTIAVAVAGRRSHIDTFLGSVVSDDIQLVAAPRYYDYQALVSWRPDATHEFELFLLGSDDRMTLVFDDIGSIDAEATDSSLRNATSFQRLKLRHRFRPSEKIDNEAFVAIGRDDLEVTAFGRFAFSAIIDNVYARDELTLRISDRVTLVGGFDFHHQTLDFDIDSARPPKEGQPADSFESESLKASGDGLTATQTGVYSEANLEVVDGVTLVPGVRVDYFSLVRQYGFDPRIVARWEVLPELTLRAGVARVHQQPELDETVRPFGNPDLDLQAATHYALGAAYRPFAFLTTDVTLFYKDFDDLVRATDAISVQEDVATPVVYDNEGEGGAVGVELMIRYDRHADFEGWLSYTLSRSTRTDRAGAEERLFDYDQTHILTFVGTYHLGPTWSVGARWRYVSGRPTTPILGGIWRADRDAFEPIAGPTNAARLPAFHQLDLRIDKRWIFDVWELSAYLSVSNAYNRANVESLGYNYDFTKTESVSGLPVLPIFGVKGQF